MLVMVGSACLTGIDHQLDHGVLAGARHARNGPDGAALAKQVDDVGALGRGELFYVGYYMTHYA